jgi:L-amino acid N-acyltransferase YncA
MHMDEPQPLLPNPVIVRVATQFDAASLASLLNAVIAEGGKTAIQTPLSAEELADWFIIGQHCVSCVVASDPSGAVLGFQALERFHDDLPDDAADIATFVSASSRGAGVGSALFEATLEHALAHELGTVRAVIGSENEIAIGYYRSLGFRCVAPGDDSASVTLIRALAGSA